jgi:hypothetical protein
MKLDSGADFLGKSQIHRTNSQLLVMIVANWIASVKTINPKTEILISKEKDRKNRGC